MVFDDRCADTLEHREAADLIPWYVNASIGASDRERLEAHLRLCDRCSDDMARELRVFQGMTADVSVEYMPAASLKRLQSRLEGIDEGVGATIAAPAPSRLPLHWKGLLAASVAFLAIGLGLPAAEHALHYRDRTPVSPYHTVTTPTNRPPGEVIRAVFAPGVTLAELQRILDESELRLVSGPTEAGVFSLAASSRRPVSESLALLRRHSEVRFAESTQAAVATVERP